MGDYILVVDDDPDLRETMRVILERKEYEVTTAADGREALELIARDPPSVMLLDLRMPVLDGAGVARYLHEQGKHIPTVVVTAEANPCYWREKLGAEAWLAKPFDASSLLAIVTRVSSQQRGDEDDHLGAMSN